MAFQDQLLERVRALPGVESATFARVIPFGLRDFSSAPIAVEGYQPGSDERPTADYNQVGPDYFAVMGIPMLRGREFSRDDDARRPLVAIVDETMGARYWPGKDPVGGASSSKINGWRSSGSRNGRITGRSLKPPSHSFTCRCVRILRCKAGC